MLITGVSSDISRAVVHQLVIDHPGGQYATLVHPAMVLARATLRDGLAIGQPTDSALAEQPPKAVAHIVRL
jgi:hypothetical protein